jgi:hypothetical protein
MLPPLSVPDTITVLRARYPDALVCTACGLLLATQLASYAMSGLTEDQRLEYVCAECQYDLAEKDRVRAVKVAQAHVASRASVAAREARKEREDRLHESVLDSASGTRMDSGDSSRVSMTARRGGRPRKYASDQIRQREASRAYRERRRAQQVRP